jgi:hypothetical protein
MAEGGGINSLNIKLTADPDALKKGLDTAVKALQTGGDRMKQQTEKMTSAMGKWNKTATDVGQTASRQSRALQNLANSYAAMGDAGTAGLRATAAEAIELKRRMEDVQGIIGAADLEGKFKTGAIAIGKMTQGIAGVQGAMHMLGVSTEGAAETMANLQSLMAMSQALEAISSIDGEIMALTKNSATLAAVWKGIQMLMRPGPLLLVGAAVSAIALAFQEVPKPAKAVSSELIAIRGLQESLSESAQKTEGRYHALTGVLTSSNSTLDMRRAALAQLQEMMPAYFKNLDVEKSSHEAVKKAINDGAKALREKAMAQAVEQRMTDLASREIAKQIELEQQKRDLQKFDMRKGETEWQAQKMKGTVIQSEIYAIQKEREELVKIAASVGDEFTKALQDGMSKSETGSGSGKGKGKGIGTNVVTPAKDIVDEQKKEIEKAIAEIQSLPVLQARGSTGQTAPGASIPINLSFDQAQAGKTGERVMAQVSALNSGLQSAMAGTVDNISNLISDMFTQPEDAFRNFGNAMLATLGQFMSQLGKAIIAAGTASQVFQKALLANPGLAIAAGAALVMAGAAVTGMMKQGMNARAAQDTGGGGGTPQGIRPFATGGIVSGPTLGLMGEYAGARSNPEVVAPLDKLKSMLGGGTGTLTTRVSGTDLLIMLDRAERNRGRVR